MKSKYFNSEYLGEQTPWFGPVIEGYRSIVSSATMDLKKEFTYDLTAWVWDNAGNLLDERVLGSCKARDLLTIDVQAEFPVIAGRSGVVGVLCHAIGAVTPRVHENWVTRFISASGKVTTSITSGNPGNLNFPARSGRPYAYRMCSQELVSDADWKTLSWHANVSADPGYDKTIHPILVAINEQGERLESAPIAIPAFGAVLVDIEEIFGDRLRPHLKNNRGRGSYMMHAADGGAMGYHFLQRRTTGELAGDHTRPILMYLNAGYGSAKDSTPATALNFLKSSVRYFRFRAGL